MTLEKITTNAPLRESTRIQGVYYATIKAFADERGQFMETFRREWFPWVNWDKAQSNRSDSKAGVLRGLHYHFRQIDYWYVPRGVIRAAMVDLRRHSPTFMAAEVMELGDTSNLGMFVPEGVAHGYLALTDCTLMYQVNNYYDGGRDEFGVAWNDPDLNIAWGADKPLISARDAANPRLRDIPAEQMPK